MMSKGVGELSGKSLVLSLNIYYNDNIKERTAQIVEFFGLPAGQPDIGAIGVGSAVTPESFVGIFPRSSCFVVENEFAGAQRAAEVAAADHPGAHLLIANDSLGRHWTLSWVRRRWFRRALREANGRRQFVVISEHYIGRPEKFPGTVGVKEWYTSNYFYTNAPKTLARAFDEARRVSKDVPDLFRREAELFARKLLASRGVKVTAERLESKVTRTWTEVCLFHTIRASGLDVVPASMGRSLPNRFLHRFIDR